VPGVLILGPPGWVDSEGGATVVVVAPEKTVEVARAVVVVSAALIPVDSAATVRRRI